MGRRYYCDYCDKTFIDDLYARKKHLTGTHHIKLRKLHYEQHRDPKTTLAEESYKTPCRRYLQHGDCPFSGICKYTHYSQEDLWNLKQRIELDEYEQKQKAQEVPDVPSLESWVVQYNESHNDKSNKEETNKICTFWTYPEHLECRTDLPPSLKRFNPGDFSSGDFDDWGV